MIGGALVTAVATLLFGFARPVAGVFSGEGSKLVCTSGTHAGGGSILIVPVARGPVNMLRYIRHLCYGLLNKRRCVSCGLLTDFIG